jgi:hypothetical protein
VRPIVSLRRALDDPDLLGSILGGQTWLAWRAVLLGAMGEALSENEQEAFRRLTGRPQEPLQRVEEFWGVIGRRGGKTRAAACLAVYIAALCDHSDSLAAGERGLVMCLAQNQRTAAVAFSYAAAIFESQPLLAGLVTNRTVDTLTLSTGVDLEIRPASFRGLRGVTAVAVIADEAAFWHTDETSANADTEILNAVRPALATTGGPLVVISSPYAKRGEVYGAYRRHFGPGGDPLILVAQGASRDFNPGLPQRVVDRAYERDAEVASAEYGGLFRGDLESFVSREAIDAVVSVGVFERAPVKGIRYTSFCDLSGGSSDSMTLAIAHREKDVAVLDCVRERRAPFSPDDCVREFSDVMRSYGIAETKGDRYSAEWCRERFRVHRITYRASDLTKSDLYLSLLPAINSRRVDLLDDARLISQLAGLERRAGRNGKDSVDHRPGSRDDTANAVAGCLVNVIGRRNEVAMAGPLFFTLGGIRFNELGGLTPRMGSDPWSRLMEEERRRPGGPFA